MVERERNSACMFFVFCALLEFALINSHMRKSEKYDHISKTFATSPSEFFSEMNGLSFRNAILVL